MSRPTLKVEAAFGHGPFDTSKTWTDLTDRAISVSAKHGRDSELASFQAGSMTVTLDGSDRHLDPTYAAGPYYGDLKPMVPIRSYWRHVEGAPDETPVMDTAVLWLDARDYAGSAGTASLPWENKGTLGSAVDGAIATGGDAIAATYLPWTSAGGPGFVATDSTSGAKHWLRIPHHSKLDIPNSGATVWMFDVTVLAQESAGNKIAWKYPDASLPASEEGWVAEYVPSASPPNGPLITAGASAGPVFSGATSDPDDWDTGLRCVIGFAAIRSFGVWALFRIDEDGTYTTLAVASTLGSLGDATTASDVLLGRNFIWHNVACFDAVLTEDQAIAAAEEMGVVKYPVGYGYAQAWPQDYEPPSKCTVRVQCPDVFSVLANAPLPGGSPLAALISADGPTHWWPLNDEEGASFFVDLGSDAVQGRARGGANPGFGSAGLDAGDQAATAWEADGTDKGYLDTALALGTSWDTLLFLLRADTISGGVGRTILRDSFTVLVIRDSDLSDPGVLDVTRSGDTGGSGGTRSTVRIDDGEPHVVVMRRNGGTPKWTVYVDGTSVGSAAAAGNFSTLPATSCLGGVPGAQATAFLDGTLQHVAVFSTDKTSRATAYYQASLGWDSDLTGERIGHVLDAVGHPTAERDLDDGTITLGPTDWSDNTRALGELQAVEKTEQGKLYQRPDGVLTFRQRHAWVTATRSATSQYTLSDDNAESLHYERGIAPTNGVETIINVVTVNWSGGQVVVKDQDSIDAYGPRDYSVTTSAPSAAVARSIGEYLIAQYAQPTDRFETVTLNPAADSRTWTAALDVQVGDRITVERTPQETGDPIVQESIVEAKQWSIEDGINKAAVELTLSPADTNQYWIWGTSEWGETADPTTRWG